MKLHDAEKRIDRITVALLVDWTLFGFAPLAGASVQVWAYLHLQNELRFDDVDATTLKVTYSIYFSALWIGVLLFMGMTRIRIVLREIRRDALEKTRHLVPVEPATPPEHLRRHSSVCPACGQRLRIPTGYRHHRAQCRACGHRFAMSDIPNAAEAKA